MRHHRIDPESNPPKNGESWWVVHPNRKGCEFRAPIGAVTICTKSYKPFKINCIAQIIGVDYHNGWITLKETGGDYCDMPFYFFARHFDAEAFVVGAKEDYNLNKATPFNYRPTVPAVRFADDKAFQIEQRNCTVGTKMDGK